MYTGLTTLVLGTLKYIQTSHSLSPAVLSFRLTINILMAIIDHVIEALGTHITFWDPQTLILFGIRYNSQSSGRNILLCLFIRIAIKLSAVSIDEYHLSSVYKILSKNLLSRLTLYIGEIIANHLCCFLNTRNWSTIYQINTWEKFGNSVWQYIGYLYTSRKPLIQARSIVQHAHWIRFTSRTS
jgi:hypothetical protein